MGVTTKAWLGHHPVSYSMCHYHKQEKHYEHNVFVGHRMLAATLLQFPEVPGLLAVISTEETNVIRRQRVTSSKCHGLSQTRFLHSTNIMDLFIKLGKYLSLQQESEHELRR